MSPNRLYLPLLLRIFHNANALLVLGAIATGFWVYDTYDGRFGKLPLPAVSGIIDIHGTIAVSFFLLLPAFALYSFHAGQQRLIQPGSLQQLAQPGRPVWWYSLHRVVNTTLLVAATLAGISGRMMSEEWLPAGELNHSWYYAHLMAWLVMVIVVATHLLMLARVGGKGLVTAMLSVKFRPEESPKLWPKRVHDWLRQLRSNS